MRAGTVDDRRGSDPQNGGSRLPWIVGFLGKRLVWAVATLFIFLTVVFFFVQLWVPYDFATQFGQGGLDEGVRQDLGLDRPLAVRYVDYVSGLVRGDLGTSFEGGSVWEVIEASAPITIFEFAVGAVVAYAVGELLGRWSAWRSRRVTGSLLSVVGVVSATIFPPFLVFLLIQGLRGPLLDLRNFLDLPSDSLRIWREAAVEPGEVLALMAFGLFGAVLVALVLRAYGHKRRLPAVSLLAFPVTITAAVAGIGVSGVGVNAVDLLYRADVSQTVGQGSPILVLVGVILLTFGQVMFMMRVGIEDERSEDYVLTARAKGLTEPEVRDRHVARNALAPTLAGTFLAFPTIIAGMAIVELQLQVRGLSFEFFEAIEFQDIPVVMGVLAVLGVIGIGFRLVTDVAIAYLDPRQRSGDI